MTGQSKRQYILNRLPLLYQRTLRIIDAENCSGFQGMHFGDVIVPNEDPAKNLNALFNNFTQ